MINNGKNSLVTVKNVQKRFPLMGGGEVTILKDISFDIGYGEFASIVGPSGNGKTTLLNMITGIDRPSDGDVIVGGQSLNSLSENQMALWRRENVGIIFQSFNLLPSLTLVKNVILPMDLADKFTPQERHERAMHLLERVNLVEIADNLPHAVSGGQQQRVGIARAVALDPPLIVGDEPTGRLDRASAEIAFEMFESWVAEGKTMLMVTHDKELANRVARKIEIVEGHVVRDSYIGVSDWGGS